MSEPASASTTAPRSRVEVRRAWIERLTRFPASGLTPAQFCAHEGVSLASFYAWKRRLAADPPATDHARADADPGPRLLPVRLATPDRAVELVLPGGTVVRLLPGCDLAFVRALLDALGAPPC
jgi:putative transposase